MFTGLIEQVGRVASLSEGVLLLDVDPSWGGDCGLGESVAVNGVCLTVVARGPVLRFDLSPETLRRTSLSRLRSGSLVNLERAMQAGGRFGGHIVQGHVDATGSLDSVRQEGNSQVLRFAYPGEYGKYLIEKGSVAVDGISLTVVAPDDRTFEVWIIPHTLEMTHLADLQPGDPVNLEFDLIAKYVERLLPPRH
jgi:riboflavin synthase